MLLQNLRKQALRTLKNTRRLSSGSAFKNASFFSSRRLAFQTIGGAAVLFSGALILHQFSQPVSLDARPGNINGVTVEEVQKHTTPETGIWIVINGKVYDLTEFRSSHPAGAKIIEKYAGKDASKIFNKYHAPNFPDQFLTPDKHLGPLIGEMEIAEDITEMGDSQKREEYLANLPDLDQIMNASDFEYICEKILSPTAWYYYSSGSDDEMTLRENHNAFSRIFFKPRVLVDVSNTDMSTELLGAKTSAPFYCSAAAQAKLGHPDGELSIARGCAHEDIIQMISTYASYPFDEIAGQVPGQTQWFQLYMNGEQSRIDDLIKAATEKKMGGIFVTVDTPQLGRREKDLQMRAKMDLGEDPDEDAGAKLAADQSDAKDLATTVVYADHHAVTWKDIERVQKLTDVPILLKGVQTAADVVLAAERGIKAVVISNHGGRQLDYSPAPVEVLAEAIPALKEKNLQDKIEVYIDGGVRRGSDIIKAVALGAKGVGLGRMYLYANSAYGEEGVRKLTQMLKKEMELDMKFLGVQKLSDLTPEHLDLHDLHHRQAPLDAAYYRNYRALNPPKFKHEDDDDE